MTTRIAFASLFVLGLAACGGNTPEPSAPTPAAPAPATPAAESGHHAAPAGDAKGPLVAPGSAKVGDKTTCPISGEEFVVEATSPKVEHEGKTYYFCCPGCEKKFAKDTAKYIGPKT